MCDPSLQVESLCREVAIYLLFILSSFERNHYANIEHMHDTNKTTRFLIAVESKRAATAE